MINEIIHVALISIFKRNESNAKTTVGGFERIKSIGTNKYYNECYNTCNISIVRTK